MRITAADLVHEAADKVFSEHTKPGQHCTDAAAWDILQKDVEVPLSSVTAQNMMEAYEIVQVIYERTIAAPEIIGVFKLSCNSTHLPVPM